MALTWQEIMALSEDALNLALEPVAGRTWKPFAFQGGHFWLYTDAEGMQIWDIVPHLHTTTSWEAVVPLLWRAGLSLQMVGADRALCWYQKDAEDARYLTATSEHEARVHLCRLVLWRTTQPAPVSAAAEAP